MDYNIKTLATLSIQYVSISALIYSWKFLIRASRSQETQHRSSKYLNLECLTGKYTQDRSGPAPTMQSSQEHA